MSSSNRVIWRCDRCHATADQEVGNQPRGWGRVTWVEPPLASPESSSHRAVDLCKSCYTRVRDLALYDDPKAADEA